MTDYQAFKIELFEELLEDASFLYEHRLSMTHDPELSWLELEDFENRLEPLLEGLYVGGDLALKVCAEQALMGDYGELHAAVRIMVRHNRWDLFEALFENEDKDEEEDEEEDEPLDLEDPEVCGAMAHALAIEAPRGWDQRLLELAERLNPAFLPVVARYFGYHRQAAANAYLVASRAEAGHRADVLWSYLRGIDPSARGWLQKLCTAEDEEISGRTRHDAALACLRLGDEQIYHLMAPKVTAASWVLLPLGLAGSRTDAKRLIEHAKLKGMPGTDGFAALGLLGEISAVDLLIAYLAMEEVAEKAALALWLITGAPLYEEVFIPEETDEEELFEHELESFREKGVYIRPDGEVAGSELERISQDQTRWAQWWKEHRGQFEAGKRYRSGKLYSPAVLLENLCGEAFTNQVREWVYHELVIRYQADVPFEIHMPIRKQKEALNQYALWIGKHGEPFEPGAWYLRGLKR
ncbi:hypothetical protein SCOR_16645 [Sulfidibacter corallicola]|uniref:TIGR02270 family protein n=1 Tax=Sulfidibacter corallicola TaxID=2818388 RepID=A0A8A4TVD4_SULCO|nr:hypothetical protein [Sulfidibacter corallicola]QTD53909.1 hypothetical protein J3U87_15785 [Sulfidibacter corallicola]